ncbi:MAG: GIY-YIG nuclease family protein [Nitrospirota bacterium]
MGTLKCGNVDFNDPQMANAVRQGIQHVLNDPTNYYALAHANDYYFSTPAGPLTNESGWYVILDGKIPIYVGKAENLDNRLNTQNGSRDQFANPQRSSDIERNFIKKYTELGIIHNLRVCLIKETALFPNRQLTELDRA